MGKTSQNIVSDAKTSLLTQSAAERFTRDASAGTAGDERDLILEAVADEGDEIFLIARHDDAAGFDLEVAGVGAVEGAREVVEKKLSLEEPLQVVANSASALRIHR